MKARSRRLQVLGVFAVAAALLIPTSTGYGYTQDPYNSSHNTFQDNNCRCVVASTLTTLKYISGSTIPSQSTLDSQESNWDKYDWGGCGHDPRGWATGLYAYTPGGYHFNDYKYSSQWTMNLEFVLGIRADSHPVGAIVEAGKHAVDIVGYVTNQDPWNLPGLTINGFYIIDPWYGRGNSGMPNWPYNGFAPNSYITISSWNTYYYKPDIYEGSFWYNKYDGVLRSTGTGAPSDTQPQSYGDYIYDLNHGGLAPDPALVDAAPAVSSPTIDGAVRAGLVQNELEEGGTLGTDLTDFQIGPRVHVESLAAGIPSYQLVELLVDQTPRAMVLLSETDTGYAFGAITPLSAAPGFMSSAGRGAALAGQGMAGRGELVWAPVANSTPFGPFIRGVDAKTAQTAFLTMRGRLDSIEAVPGRPSK